MLQESERAAAAAGQARSNRDRGQPTTNSYLTGTRQAVGTGSALGKIIGNLPEYLNIFLNILRVLITILWSFMRNIKHSKKVVSEGRQRFLISTPCGKKFKILL